MNESEQQRLLQCLIKARISLIFIKNQNVVFIMP